MRSFFTTTRLSWFAEPQCSSSHSLTARRTVSRPRHQRRMLKRCTFVRHIGRTDHPICTLPHTAGFGQSRCADRGRSPVGPAGSIWSRVLRRRSGLRACRRRCRESLGGASRKDRPSWRWPVWPGKHDPMNPAITAFVEELAADLTTRGFSCSVPKLGERRGQTATLISSSPSTDLDS